MRWWRRFRVRRVSSEAELLAALASPEPFYMEAR